MSPVSKWWRTKEQPTKAVGLIWIESGETLSLGAEGGEYDRCDHASEHHVSGNFQIV